MLHGKKIIVVMPAYHAEKTLAACYEAIPHDIVDEVLLVDDVVRDRFVARRERLLRVIRGHDDDDLFSVQHRPARERRAAAGRRHESGVAVSHCGGGF